VNIKGGMSLCKCISKIIFEAINEGKKRGKGSVRVYFGRNLEAEEISSAKATAQHNGARKLVPKGNFADIIFKKN